MMMNGELAGFTIPRLGMGTMALAIEGRPDRDTAIRTIHAGLDAGVRYLDTAWSYYLPSEPGTGTAEDLGYGEKLVCDALALWDGPEMKCSSPPKPGIAVLAKRSRPLTVRMRWALMRPPAKSAFAGRRQPLRLDCRLRPETMIRDAKESALHGASIRSTCCIRMAPIPRFLTKANAAR